jgi:hypothetical protein
MQTRGPGFKWTLHLIGVACILWSYINVTTILTLKSQPLEICVKITWYCHSYFTWHLAIDKWGLETRHLILAAQNSQRNAFWHSFSLRSNARALLDLDKQHYDPLSPWGTCSSQWYSISMWLLQASVNLVTYLHWLFYWRLLRLFQYDCRAK